MSKEDVISLALTVIPDFLYDMTDERVMDLPLESCLNLSQRVELSIRP